MTKPKIAGIILTLVILAGLGYGLYYFQAEYDAGKDIIHAQVYSGRVYLTNDEYDEFKRYLADHPDIYISKMDVLSSDNPLVTFRVTVPGDAVFPWGEIDPAYTAYKATRSWQVFASILVALGALALIVVVWFVRDWSEG